MTYPTLANTYGVGRTSTTQIHSFTCPAFLQNTDADTVGYNAVVSQGMGNNMRLAIIGFGANPNTVTMPASWVLCGSTVQGTSVYMRAYWSQAFAQHDGVTLTCSTSSAIQSAIAVLNILDSGSNSLPIQGAVAAGSSTNADPPSLTPTSFTGENILWIAACAIDAGQWVTAYPTNYSENQFSVVGSGSAGVGLGIATRVTSAAAENPGTFTSSRNAWNAMTFAVRNTATPDRAFISRPMFGAAAESWGYAIACSLDNVLLNEQRYSDLSRFATDYLFLLDATSAVYVASGDSFVTNVACVTDYLFLDSYRIAETERLLSDGVLLYDVDYRETARLAYDTLLLNDSATSELERVIAAIDYLLLGYARVSEQLAEQQDGALMLDGRVSDVAHGFLDSMFVDDSVMTGVDRIVDALDNLLLYDYTAQLDTSRSIQDAALLADTYTSDLERVLQDAMFLLSLRAGEQDAKHTDYLLLDSYAFKVLEKLVQDNLLLNDTVEALRNATETILEFVDSILMGDDRISELDRNVLDGLLTLSLLSKVLERIDAEGVLLNDSTSIAERFVTVLAVDYLLTLTQRSSEVEMRIAESALLNDAAFRDLACSLLDNLYLIDDATREHLRAFLDPLFADSSSIRDRSMLSDADALLLNDSAFRDLARAAIDTVLLGSGEQREREIVAMDSELLDDLIVLARELLRDEGMLLGDTSALVLGIISSTMITYARLAHKRLLSPTIGGRDALSRRLGKNANTLDRTLGYASWRLWQ